MAVNFQTAQRVRTTVPVHCESLRTVFVLSWVYKYLYMCELVSSRFALFIVSRYRNQLFVFYGHCDRSQVCILYMIFFMSVFFSSIHVCFVRSQPLYL